MTNVIISDITAQKRNNRMFLTAELFWANVYEAPDETYNSNRSELMYILTHPPATVTTMPEYISHFEEYLDRLSGSLTNVSEQILTFMMPLNPMITFAMTSQDIKTLDDAETLATRYSVTLSGRIFHEGLARAQLTTNNSEPSSRSSATSDELSPTNNIKPKKDMSNIQCFVCNQVGHYARNCKLKHKTDLKISRSSHYKRRIKRRMNERGQRKAVRNFIDINEQPRG